MYKRIIFFIVILVCTMGIGYGKTISPDGSLADWKGIDAILLDREKCIVYNKPLWHGPNDVSAKVYITNSKNYIYIAAEVIDDSLMYARTKKAFSILHSDHIEIWIDTFPLRKERYKMDQYVHQFIFNIDEKKKECIELYPKKMNNIKSIKYSTRKIKKGYIFEVRIPGYILNSPGVNLKNIGILVDIVDVDRGDKTKQGSFLSLSPKRKWGNPSTFYNFNFIYSPLYTYKAYGKVSQSSLFYGKVKFADISNDGIKDLIFYTQYKDASGLEVGYISPSSLEVRKIFKYKLPIIEIYPEIIRYSRNITFLSIRGETLTGYPVIEVFKWNKEEKTLENIGIVVSKGTEVYPEFKDIDKDERPEILLYYKDKVRIYKYMEGRYRLEN